MDGLFLAAGSAALVSAVISAIITLRYAWHRRSRRLIVARPTGRTRKVRPRHNPSVEFEIEASGESGERLSGWVWAVRGPDDIPDTVIASIVSPRRFGNTTARLEGAPSVRNARVAAIVAMAAAVVAAVAGLLSGG